MAAQPTQTTGDSEAHRERSGNRSRIAWASLYIVGSILGLLGLIIATRGPAIEIDIPPAAYVDEKYEHFLRRVHAPQDATRYGEFDDNGYSRTDSYAGEDNLPPGYWVYVRPHWYIWRDRPVEDADQPPSEEALARASVDGKYQDFARRIPVPEDASRYGAFNDHGRRTSTIHGVYTDLPPGYWVYVDPYWYIWLTLR